VLVSEFADHLARVDRLAESSGGLEPPDRAAIAAVVDRCREWQRYADEQRARAEELESRLALIDTGCRNCGGLPHTTTCAWRDVAALADRAEVAEQAACGAAFDLGQLYEHAAVAVTEFQDFTGHASGYDATRHALHRLGRVLSAMTGGHYRVREPLWWRLVYLDSLEHAGFRTGADDQVRKLLPGQPAWERASGPTLAEEVERLRYERDVLIQALHREVVDYALERSLCMRCRTETAQPHEGWRPLRRVPHKHAPTCPLYGLPDGRPPA
jgi:hypothetical protein